MPEVINRTAKKLYEEKYILNSRRQFYYTMFENTDIDKSAGFLLDKYIQTPYAVGYIQRGGQANVRIYQPGEGELLIPPLTSEQTPLTSELLDKVATGVEAQAGFGRHEVKIINDILDDHTTGHNMAKNYQAMRVFAEGKFFARNKDGDDIGLDVDYKRDASLDKTYTFTGGGTISLAFGEALSALFAQGTPKQDLCVIMGENWLKNYAEDSDIQTYMRNNNANGILSQDMIPPQLRNTEGLYVVGRYRVPGQVAPLWLLGYTPPVGYVAKKGDSQTDYVGANEAIFFSLMDKRWKVYRGVDALNGNEKRVRVAGDLVWDNYTEKNPVATHLRSQSRHIFVYGNINHTCRSVGTFS